VRLRPSALAGGAAFGIDRAAFPFLELFELRGAGAIEAARTLETGRADREANMWAFTRAALELLDACIQQAGGTS